MTILSRRAVGLGLLSAALPFAPDVSATALLGKVGDQDQFARLDFSLFGKPVQGGYVIGKADPLSVVTIDDKITIKLGTSGVFIVGLDRDSPASCKITGLINKTEKTAHLSVAKTVYNIQAISGLPQQTVTPTDPKIIKRVKKEQVLKAQAFMSQIATDSFKDGFIMPLTNFRVSGAFGNQRVLNGEPKSPHYGFDMAAPAGSVIYAPADGKVVLAEPDMFFEGGLTFIDHGQGLIAMYLHQSKLFVKQGEMVKQGQKIGLVGAKGRATGPHLCWRLKWQGRYLDPSLLVRS